MADLATTNGGNGIDGILGSGHFGVRRQRGNLDTQARRITASLLLTLGTLGAVPPSVANATETPTVPPSSSTSQATPDPTPDVSASDDSNERAPEEAQTPDVLAILGEMRGEVDRALEEGRMTADQARALNQYIDELYAYFGSDPQQREDSQPDEPQRQEQEPSPTEYQPLPEADQPTNAPEASSRPLPPIAHEDGSLFVNIIKRAPTVRVNDTTSLVAALKNAKPNDVIEMSPGYYKGKIEVTAQGTAEQPITIRGTKDSIIDGGDMKTGYALHVNGARHIICDGFTVTNAQKGIMVDGSSHVVLNDLFVNRIGQEGVHFRKFSSDNVLQASVIRDTGLVTPGYGEGVYLGSAVSNFKKLTNGNPDRSDRNRVIGNTIERTAAEGVDIKEGTEGGIVAHNRFDGAGMRGENGGDSFVDVKGSGYRVQNNIGSVSGPSHISTGIQVHKKDVAKSGEGNSITGNDFVIAGKRGNLVEYFDGLSAGAKTSPSLSVDSSRESLAPSTAP